MKNELLHATCVATYCISVPAYVFFTCARRWLVNKPKHVALQTVEDIT